MDKCIVIFILQLNTGGYLTFGPDEQSNTCDFSLSTSSLPSISPVSTESMAAVILHYRAIPQESEDQEDDKAVLTEVATKIHKFNLDLDNFKPSLATVTTWKMTINNTVSE